VNAEAYERRTIAAVSAARLAQPVFVIALAM
jgi:hypothetical protein